MLKEGTAEQTAVPFNRLCHYRQELCVEPGRKVRCIAAGALAPVFPPATQAAGWGEERWGAPTCGLCALEALRRGKAAAFSAGGRPGRCLPGCRCPAGGDGGFLRPSSGWGEPAPSPLYPNCNPTSLTRKWVSKSSECWVHKAI